MRVFINSRESFKAESLENQKRFFRKDGLLNSYAFAYGYVEYYTAGSLNLTIGQYSCAFIVKGKIGNVFVYEDFNTAKEARKYIRGRIAELRKNA